VLRSGVELVLVGQPCYPPPAWVEALFSGGARSAEGDELDQESVLRPRQLSRAAQATGVGVAESEGAHPEAALRLRRLGELDPYAYCYDPLALLYLLQPDAFDTAESLPVRVTADGLLERCTEAEAQGPCSRATGRRARAVRGVPQAGQCDLGTSATTITETASHDSKL